MLSRFGRANILSQLHVLRRKSAARTAATSAHSTEDTDGTYDIVINGGGIVGFSLLASFARSQFLRDRRVLLMEQQPDRPANAVQQPSQRISNRVSSLTMSSKRFFKDIGVWNDIKPFAKEIKLMHVWSDHFKNGITFTPARPTLTGSLGGDLDGVDNVVCYIVENHVILSALKSIVDSTAKDCVKYGTSLIDFALYEDGNGLNVVYTNSGQDGKSESKLSTQLLVGCDGFNSTVRRKSNFTYFESELDEAAIVGTVRVANESEIDPNDVSYQRFDANDGVLAILPLTNEYCSFVLSATKERVPELMATPEDEFVSILNDHLSNEMEYNSPAGLRMSNLAVKGFLNSVVASLGRWSAVPPPRLHPPLITDLDPNSRASFPLGFGTTSPNFVGSPIRSDVNRVVLIGDSAHRIHPLAGQGLNLGLGDAAVLSQCLHAALARGEDLFNWSHERSERQLEDALFEFDRQRQLKVIPMMAAIHSMKQLFAFVPPSAMTAFNGMNIVKNQIVRFANSM